MPCLYRERHCKPASSQQAGGLFCLLVAMITVIHASEVRIISNHDELSDRRQKKMIQMKPNIQK